MIPKPVAVNLVSSKPLFTKPLVQKVIRSFHPRAVVTSLKECTDAGAINHVYKVCCKNPGHKFVIRGVSNKFPVEKYKKEMAIHTLIKKKVFV